MIVTDRFVYVHIPKTGGTFVEAAAGEVVRPSAGLYIDTSEPENRGRFGVSDQHERRCDIPDEHRDKPLLITVRNPYDHHVSLYEFGWWRTHPGDTFDAAAVVKAYPHFPDLSFAEYLRAVHDWDLAEPSYAPAGGYADLARLDVGPLSFDFVRYVAADPEKVLARLEDSLGDRSWLPSATFLPMHRLSTALRHFLVDQGYDGDRVLQMGRVHPHGSTRTADMTWPGYYDDDSLALVRHQERLLFELFPEFDDQVSAASR